MLENEDKDGSLPTAIAGTLIAPAHRTLQFRFGSSCLWIAASAGRGAAPDGRLHSPLPC
jgi:hypothetical protein